MRKRSDDLSGNFRSDQSRQIQAEFKCARRTSSRRWRRSGGRGRGGRQFVFRCFRAELAQARACWRLHFHRVLRDGHSRVRQRIDLHLFSPCEYTREPCFFIFQLYRDGFSFAYIQLYIYRYAGKNSRLYIYTRSYAPNSISDCRCGLPPLRIERGKQSFIIKIYSSLSLVYKYMRVLLEYSARNESLEHFQSRDASKREREKKKGKAPRFCTRYNYNVKLH